ncbi:MAG: YggT family protein [Clostridiales bacterium]|nr:YggT family protein [Clostridiales bacterium]
MIGVIYVITKIVSIFLTILQFMMLIRAIMSWLPIDDDSNLSNFLYAMTEPVIYPVRALLSRIEALNELPIDISFIVAFMLLSIIQILLPSITL